MPYKSVYPPAYNSTYVKATSNHATFYPYLTCDPSQPLTGSYATQWLSAAYSITNQRFHIDLGVAKVIKRIYYENSHSSGTQTDMGAKNFILQGSNDAGAFGTLTYATDTNWTQLTTNITVFVQHVASNVADPHFVIVANNTPYRYYAIKIADGYGDTEDIGLRRVELQVITPPQIIIF